MKHKLSVVLATFNEESNLYDCLESIRGIADEIIIVDGSSTDRTVDIAKSFDAQIIITTNPPMFHVNKQKAIDLASCDWILQLDADERVGRELAAEIKSVINMTESEIRQHQENLSQKKLFLRHQKIIESRDGSIGVKESEYAAFFIPRLNYFLGKYLRYGGVYPDGVIRLIKKGKGRFPCKDVHEQITVNGKVGWIQKPLYHNDSPTFKRYMQRNSKYIDRIAQNLADEHLAINPKTSLDYLFLKPILWFFITQFRHKGILDGYQGIIFSFFSALRFPRAYLRYINNLQSNNLIK
jgi:glycosyltransferase involved in cell wall biosynthesis